MAKWLKVAVPLGIAAVLLSVLAFGFGSQSTEAAKPGSDTTMTALGCVGDGPGSVNVSGTASSTASYQFDYCSSTDLMIWVTLSWSKVNKHLDLVVTEPDGTQHPVSGPNTNVLNYSQNAPLPEGTWTVDVVNRDKGPVDFALSVRFLCGTTTC